jgi:ubiquinol-cytochrome c reductase iron-sulfur subunit
VERETAGIFETVTIQRYLHSSRLPRYLSTSNDFPCLLVFKLVIGTTGTIKHAAASRALATKAVASLAPPSLDSLGSVDHMYEDDRVDKVAEPERRAFTYLLLSGVRFAYASTARFLVVKFVASMSASADVLALAFSEFDLSNIDMGKTVTVKWRGKPVFIRRRTPEEIAEADAVPMDVLRDQETDADRTLKQEYIVVLGICPHLGCVPMSNAGDFNGWFCPCHGSHYDVSGRIRKGPAPLNLEVPPYKFIDENIILMG